MSTARPFATVIFPRRISGVELIDAVNALSIDGGNTDFWQGGPGPHADNDAACVIGQVSPNLYEQMKVVDSSDPRGVDWILPHHLYSIVRVVSHAWPVGYVAGSDSRADAVVAVNRFADRLREYFRVGVLKSPWPQEVAVCATCNTITWLVHGDPYCPNDGGNPPIKTVKVAPVE